MLYKIFSIMQKYKFLYAIKVGASGHDYLDVLWMI